MSKHFALPHRSTHFFKGVGYSALTLVGIAASVVLAGAASASAGSGVGIPLAMLLYAAAVGTATLSVATGANAALQFGRIFEEESYSCAY